MQRHSTPKPDASASQASQAKRAPRSPLDEQASKSGPTDPELQNEGEGSRSATRRYDAGAERTAANPKHVEEAAEKARKALEGSEADDLRRAEERGKKGQRA